MKCCAVEHSGARFIRGCTKTRQKYFAQQQTTHEPHAQIDLLIDADSDYIPANNNNKETPGLLI
jgi:hypothetical protein